MAKRKNYKVRSIVYKTLGFLTTAIGTISGFVIYEMIIDWENFKKEIDNFIVVTPEHVKLNLVIALPILIGILVFLSVIMRKNREFFKDKVSLSLLTTIVIFYLVYSVIEMTMATLIGAFVGSILDEFIFTPLSKNNIEKYKEYKDVESEYEKEKRRIKARKQAEAELNGSV